MTVRDPGHLYKLDVLDGDGEKETLRFVKREGSGYPGNVGHYPGTNCQEVLRALIDRVKYLDGQIPDSSNVAVLGHLRGALVSLEIRAARRHKRVPANALWIVDVENAPTCPECGHIGCDGKCAKAGKESDATKE